MAHFVFQDHY